MSNKVQKILAVAAFAAVAGQAMACGTTPCNNGGTNLNLTTNNNNSLTANPNATATGGVASANNNSANTNTLTANPNATANGGVATVNNNPVTNVTANPTANGGNATSNATANGGAGGNGYGGNATANGGMGYGVGYGGNANQRQGQGQIQGQSTTVNTAGTVGNVTTGDANATVQSGAVANNISYNSTYKAAASTATAAGVIGQGHGCFEHKGGFGLGVQVMTAGVSGNYNQGEAYNKDCAADQAALMIVGKTGSPVHDALAAQTAANMSPEVEQALETVKSDPSLVGLFAFPAAAPAAVAAPAVRVKPVVEDATVSQGKLQSINCGKKPTMYDPKTNTLYCGHDFK